MESDIERHVRHIKYILIIILILLCFNFKCSCSAPNELKNLMKKESIVYIIDGYKIKLRAYATNGILRIRGSVSDGKPCKKLMVNVLLETKSGGGGAITLTAKNVGPNKYAKLRKDIKINSKNEMFFEIKEIDVTKFD